MRGRGRMDSVSSNIPVVCAWSLGTGTGHSPVEKGQKEALLAGDRPFANQRG